MSSPARQARIDAGLSLQDAAKRLRVCARYLGACERTGFPLILAERAAALYGARLDVFLPPALGGNGPSGASRGAGAGRRRNRPAPDGGVTTEVAA